MPDLTELCATAVTKLCYFWNCYCFLPALLPLQLPFPRSSGSTNSSSSPAIFPALFLHHTQPDPLRTLFSHLSTQVEDVFSIISLPVSLLGGGVGVFRSAASGPLFPFSF